MKMTTRFLTIISILLCLSLTACPPKPLKKPVKKVPKPAVEKPKEAPRPASIPEPDTNQRRASNRLIESGKVFLNAKDYDRAMQFFQDAANVDASNGAAYYYLALTNAHMNQKDIALGLLDKAHALLQNDPSWVEKIEKLKNSLSSEKTVPLPPVVDEY